MSERESVIDFTVPYYDLVGITIMMKKPKVRENLDLSRSLQTCFEHDRTNILFTIHYSLFAQFTIHCSLNSLFTIHRFKSDGIESGKNGFGVFFKTSSGPFKSYLSSGENHNEGAKTSARPTMIKDEQLARL